MSSNASRELVPLLMLTPYFAPQTHAAMFRAHKLAKYLPEHGFRPVVVTTDINYLYNEDPGLLEELPGCVQVHRARFIEPTVRGLRMALGGRDRTFRAMKQAGAYAAGPGRPAPPQAPARPPGRFSMAELVRVLGEWPDRHWTWAMAARGMCERLIREQDIKLLYTSAVPASPLRLARRLQRDHGLRWIADFRDPVGYGQKHSARGLFNAAMERGLFATAMHSAEHVVGLADAYGPIFFDLYGLPESRYSFIPTGLDQAYLDPAPPRQREPVLLHVGEVMPNQSRHVFAVLQRAHALRPQVMSAYRLEFIGRREINQPRVEALVSDLPDWPYETRFIDHVPQREVYARIGAAAACLLVPGHRRYWWTNFAKLVDYIALGVPVLADVPPVSEARNELDKAGNGFFLGGEDVERDAQALLAWVEAGLPIRTDDDYRARYTARRQAEDFARVFARHAAGAAAP